MAILTAVLLAVALASPTLAGGEKCAKASEECRQAMAAAKDRGWAGLELDTMDGKLVVSKVFPTSPAARAGMLVGDVLVALNGVPLTDENQDKLARLKTRMKPGTEVLYQVDRRGQPRHLSVALATMPAAVYDAMVAKHMAEHTGAVATN